MKKFLSKFEYNSPVILTYALICVGVFVLNTLTGGKTNNMLFVTYPHSGIGIIPFLRSFLYIFGHANLSHLTGNMTLFLLVGPIVEERYGSKNLIIMIASTAFITALINNFLFSSGMLGASGIVFMLIVLSAFTSSSSDKIPITLVLVFAIYVGGEIFSGILVKDDISQFGHIAGGFCGLAWGVYHKKK